MKIRNAVKIAAAAALFAAPVASFAAPGVAVGSFGSNSLNTDGTISASSGLTCASAGINEGGFLQEQCVNGAGDTLIHTVLMDGAGFTDESYVQMGASSGASGIADKQSLVETVSGEEFTSNSKLLTGNFEDVGSMASARIHLDQGVNDLGASFATTFSFDERNGDVNVQGHDGTFTDMVIGNSAFDSTYTNTFKFENFNVEADSITATDTNVYVDGNAAAAALSGVRLDQTALLSDSASSITQTFAINERHGSFTVAAGNANHPTASLPWSAGDSIISTMVGQLIGNGVTGAGAGSMAFGLRDFAIEGGPNAGGAGVDSQVDASPASFYTPSYTDTNLADPFAAF
jgi:hypothetical protein